MNNQNENNKDNKPEDGDLWVFGYGSIVWKNAEVERTEEVSAFIRGYKRRLWQRSPDHRGTHEDPGLVASIYDADEWERLGVEKDDAAEMKGLKDDEWRVHGRAFLVTPSYRDKVKSDLDEREKQGFVAKWVPIYKYKSDGEADELITEKGLTFVATSENDNFSGFLTHKAIADIVSTHKGDSGHNLEYAVKLHQTLVKDGHPDPHISGIMSLIDDDLKDEQNF